MAENLKNHLLLALVELIELVSNKVKEIIFNEDCSEEFCLTADYSVAFFKWVSIMYLSNVFSMHTHTHSFHVYNKEFSINWNT